MQDHGTAEAGRHSASLETLRTEARELLAAAIRRAALDVEHEARETTATEMLAEFSGDAAPEAPHQRTYGPGRQVALGVLRSHQFVKFATSPWRADQ